VGENVSNAPNMNLQNIKNKYPIQHPHLLSRFTTLNDKPHKPAYK